MEEDEVGDLLTEAGGGGEDGIGVEERRRARRMVASESGRLIERFDSCLVVENIFNPTSAT